jgi:hypothetical protein
MGKNRQSRSAARSCRPEITARFTVSKASLVLAFFFISSPTALCAPPPSVPAVLDDESDYIRLAAII